MPTLDELMRDMSDITEGKVNMKKIIAFNKKLMNDDRMFVGLNVKQQTEFKERLNEQIASAENALKDLNTLEEEIKAIVYQNYKDSL